MFAEATLIWTCVAIRLLTAMLRAISSDTATSWRWASGLDAGAARRRMAVDAAIGAVRRAVRDLLPDRGHHRVDAPLAGLDRGPQPGHVLIHGAAEPCDRQQHLFLQRLVGRTQQHPLHRDFHHPFLE